MTAEKLDHPVVKPGQVWQDNDSRSSLRTVRVERLEYQWFSAGDLRAEILYAVCTVLTDSSGKPVRSRRQTAIRVERMRPTSTGYRLVTDAS